MDQADFFELGLSQRTATSYQIVCRSTHGKGDLFPEVGAGPEIFAAYGFNYLL